MTTESIEVAPPDTDDSVDREISACLNPIHPKSFFLYAGAGSGKTRSLKNALETFRQAHGPSFRKTGQKVAVITYTNAAADEIAARVGQDALFPISTIHSFCWSQVASYRADIQAWLVNHLASKLAEVREKQAKGRTGTKAAEDRARSIDETERRLGWLSQPRRFTYNPNGDNFGADALSHFEVLSVAAHFVVSKSSMRAVLINRFPFLLVDESQDTNRVLMDAIFALAAGSVGRFAVGLFGDVMQRIYADGHPDLERSIPADWARPVKRMNHRSVQRVVQLGNSLRSAVDGQRQVARSDSAVGAVRLFVASADAVDKPVVEQCVRARMAQLCDDARWEEGGTAVKTLTLEHRMAAVRRGFLPMFEALDQDPRLSTGLRQGELPGLRLFTERVAPLLAAWSATDKFAVMAHLRRSSPLLKREVLSNGGNSGDPLRAVRQAVEALAALKVDDESVHFRHVLECVATHGLFEIPAALQPFLGRAEGGQQDLVSDEEEDAEESPLSLRAWDAFLSTPYRQIVPFVEYISDRGPYGTHQGVKGLEFERVLVVLDDSDARGFLFSYEKLFGVEPLSAGDRERVVTDADTGVDRTRRLLYVTCTRARRSLALVAYTKDPDRLVSAVLKQQWFDTGEVEKM